MKNKTKDPYPITDVYHVTDTLVDAATVVVTDLCENLSNSIDTHCDDILEHLKKINTKKFNSISVGNSADGIYPVWIGVDKFNKVRKIFANTNGGRLDFDREKTKKFVSWSWDKSDLNDQFFSKSNKNKNVKRQRLFDMEIKSGAIAIADHGGHFGFEHHDAVIEALNEKYFKINNIYQNNYPIGLFIFNYGGKEEPKPSSFKSSKIHDEKVVNISDFKSVKYTEFLSNLLDEKCYPTKYIFEKYLVDEKDYEDKIQIKISDEKISGNYLSDRLPKALQILKKQNKILFGKNFKEVHEIRKSQFENFIISIIKDIEPQELNLPTFGKKESKPEVKNNKLYVETPGLPYVQETFYDGYKLKSEPSLLESATIPVKNGKYPCYIHSFPDEADEADEDGYQYNNVYVVLEGLENCYLNRNSKGQIFFDKSFKESLFLREHINKKSKKISIDKIDLRNSENLKELEKISFVEELELHGFKNIKSWDGLSKLKKLKRLKLVSCDVSFSTTENFFKNLYSLTNLEEFTIDDTCDIPTPLNKKKFSKDLYFKKLKSFEIDFREEWKKTDHENYPNYKGYGNDKVSFISAHLPNIYNFPNFEKFKSLEKLRIYNYFDFDQKEGTLFNYEYGFEDYYQPINQLCKNSKIKDIWIYGYNFKQANELASTRFLDAALKLTKDTNVKINGINKSTLKNISDKPISSTSKKINKLILINKIDEVFDEKLISQENDAITLNYFSILDDKENRGLLNDVLNQQIEEITVKPAYQFFRSENMYGDTMQPVEDHIKKNKNLKKITFEFDETTVEKSGDMDGTWGTWEYGTFASKISDWLSNYKKLKVIITHPQFAKEMGKNKNFDKYFLFFNLHQVLWDNKKYKDRFIIDGYSKKEIDVLFAKYLRNNVSSIIVLDRKEYNKDPLFRDVELISKSAFDDLYYGFKVNAGTIAVSLESSEKNYSKFWAKFSEENFYYSDGENYILSQFKDEDPVVFVKRTFLDKSNKTVFNNIKNFFYFADDFYDENKGAYKLQNKNLKIPNSINFNKPVHIKISDGGKIKFNELISKIDASELKVLILKRVLHNDLTIPYMPKLEEFDFTHRANLESIKDEIITYNKFSNLPNLRKLLIGNLFCEYLNKKKENVAQLGKVDLSDISSLKKLKTLSTWDLEPKYFKQLETLKNVDLEKISLMNLSTDRSLQIDPDSKERIIETEKCFNFLKLFKNLKKLEIHVSVDSDFKINQKFFLNYINKNIGEIKVGFGLKNRSEINAFYKNIVKKFKKIKKLDLSTTAQFRNYDNKKKKSKDGEYYYDDKTGKKFKYEKGPDPFIFDIKIFKNLKNLEYLDLYAFDANGYGVKNLLSVIKMKKLKQLILINAPEIFPTNDLKKIKGLIEKPRDEFFKQCKQKNKKIKSQYDLEGKDRKKFDLLDRDIRFGHGYGNSIDDILKERKKKKN